MSKYIQVVEVSDWEGALKHLSPAVRSVADMLSFYIAKNKVEGNGIGKIIVLFAGNGKNEEQLDVVSINTEKKIDYEMLNALPVVEARKRYLTLIGNELLTLYKDDSSITTSLMRTLSQLIDKDCIFDEKWKSKWNPSKSIQASVRWSYTDNIYFFLDIYDKVKKTTESIAITAATPGLGLIEFCLGMLRWENNNIVLLFQQNKRDYWQINTENREVEFFYQPAYSDNPHGQYNLATRYLEGHFGLVKDLEKAKYWLTRSASLGFTKSINLLKELEE